MANTPRQSPIKGKGSLMYGTKFSYAEKDFFTNKQMQVTPDVTTKAVDNSIAFLERQQEANCPCIIHTHKRGYDWIVFNRMPDRFLQLNEETDRCLILMLKMKNLLLEWELIPQLVLKLKKRKKIRTTIKMATMHLVHPRSIFFC